MKQVSMSISRFFFSPQRFKALDILHLNKKMNVEMKPSSRIFSLNDLKILLVRYIIIAAEVMKY